MSCDLAENSWVPVWIVVAQNHPCLSKGDEDTLSSLPSSPKDDVASQAPTNEVRIGPMTRARAKLIGQKVNSHLAEYDIYNYENFILPKSLYLSMIRYEDDTSIACGEGELQQDDEETISNICAREEREADTHKKNEIHLHEKLMWHTRTFVG